MDNGFKFSRPTREQHERLMRHAGRCSQMAEADLGEFLTSLGQDGMTLTGLMDSLQQIRPEVADQSLVNQAMETCTYLLAAGKLGAAQTMLELKAGSKARMLLTELMQNGARSISPALQDCAFRLLVSVSLTAKNESDAFAFLQWARQLDHKGQYTAYLVGLERLLAARKALENKKPASTVHQCLTLIRQTEFQDPLHILAHELLSDAFRGLGDAGRERQALEDWAKLFSALPNGLCDEAMNAEVSKNAPGLYGGERTEEILRRYSRLAGFYEQMPSKASRARTILKHFENVGFHDWIDAEADSKGAIRNRLEQLKACARSGNAKLKQMVLIEPERAYGKVSDDALDQIAARLAKLPRGRLGGVLLHRTPLRESKFDYSADEGKPLAQLRKALQELCEQNGAGAAGFQVREVKVLGQSPPEWLLLIHLGTEESLQGIQFGVSATAVDGQFDLRLSVIFSGKSGRLDQARLGDFLMKKPEEWQGFTALQAQAVALAKRAAGRIAERRPPGSSSGRGVAGGLREL